MDERLLDLQTLQSELGIAFRDSALLDEALTHSSFVHECLSGALPDNQRLEFLGDAILDFVVGDWLFRRYPQAVEGELTGLRAHIVRTASLAQWARAFDLGAHLRLGRGEASSGGAGRSANLCDTFEAVVGAIYLDQGLACAQTWLQTLLEARSAEIDAQRQMKSSKSRLQEHTQAALHITPTYRIVHEEGPDHAKVFTAQVLVGDEVWGSGVGNTKQAAQLAAADDAFAHRLRQATS